MKFFKRDDLIGTILLLSSVHHFLHHFKAELGLWVEFNSHKIIPPEDLKEKALVRISPGRGHFDLSLHCLNLAPDSLDELLVLNGALHVVFLSCEWVSYPKSASSPSRCFVSLPIRRGARMTQA